MKKLFMIACVSLMCFAANAQGRGHGNGNRGNGNGNGRGADKGTVLGGILG